MGPSLSGRVRKASAPFVRGGRYHGLFATFYREDGPHGVITEKWSHCCEENALSPELNALFYAAAPPPFLLSFRRLSRSHHKFVPSRNRNIRTPRSLKIITVRSGDSIIVICPLREKDIKARLRSSLFFFFSALPIMR